MDTTYLLIIGLIVILTIYYFNRKKGSKGSTLIESDIFELVGTNHLDYDSRIYISENVKAGDIVKLIPDPKNNFDNQAIKVTHNGKFIGWVPKTYIHKPNLFYHLKYGIHINTFIQKCNYKSSGIITANAGITINFNTKIS